MKSLTIAILFSCMIGPIARAGDESPASPKQQEFDSLFETYYLNKNINDVIRLLKIAELDRLFDAHESAMAGMTGFLATVFTEEPGKIDRIVKSARFTGRTRKVIERALWMSGNAKKIKPLFGKLPDFANEKPVALKDCPIKDPGDLDMMWGAFLASGDAAYAKRVLETLDESRELSGERRLDAAMRGAAEWSLRSFVLRHELVYRMAQRELKAQPQGVRKKLRKMLESIKMPKMEKSDGEFTAGLFILDDATLREFEKPRDAVLRLSNKTRARVGDIVAIKITFTGFELTDDLKALVQYDLKILDPDGGIYDETDLKNLEAYHGRTATRFTFLDNHTVTMLRFEDKDKPGTYRVRATIRDRIGKKSIALEQTITLEK
ncbi:MAG: hypothetical protein U1A27_00745 [Phycisphaerae bacterium]